MMMKWSHSGNNHVASIHDYIISKGESQTPLLQFFVRGWGSVHRLHFFSYSWFARDVTTAMLVVKNKSISLLWEVNSIFMKILRKSNFIVLTPNISTSSRGGKPRIASTGWDICESLIYSWDDNLRHCMSFFHARWLLGYVQTTQEQWIHLQPEHIQDLVYFEIWS